eukprot:CAMPEP_0204394660 /NCGR_PEP_ID=MMETSP0469-20131031/62946_1 /ASSEMBLY_ACC=CAM_ASM_000384 /TAXON_ID=2969 /ORGANISM="Oxyrrhis marina" /LENGTH=747 /DNA_ID=CAMNT_0051388769 /DNA_START=207 /DNA_END=2450 /DNA_ORIENTATION=-
MKARASRPQSGAGVAARPVDDGVGNVDDKSGEGDPEQAEAARARADGLATWLHQQCSTDDGFDVDSCVESLCQTLNEKPGGDRAAFWRTRLEELQEPTINDLVVLQSGMVLTHNDEGQVEQLRDDAVMQLPAEDARQFTVSLLGRHFTISTRCSSDVFSLQQKIMVQQGLQCWPRLFEQGSDVQLEGTSTIASIRGGVLVATEQEIRKDDDFFRVMDAVRRAGHHLEHMADRFRGNPEVVRLAAASCGRVLGFASPALRDARGIVELAIAQDPAAFRFASERLRALRPLVLRAVRLSGKVLEYVDAELCDSLDVVVAAARSSPVAVKWASARIRADREAALEIVAASPLSLCWFSEILKADRVVVLTAVKANGRALESAALEFRCDMEIVQLAVATSADALRFASRECATEVVTKNGMALENCSIQHKGDIDVVLPAVGQAGLALEFASHGLQDHRAVVSAAVKQEGRAIRFSSRRLRGDPEIVALALVPHAAQEALSCTGPGIRDNRELVARAVAADGMALRFAGPGTKEDPMIALVAVRSNPLALRFASDRIRDDAGVVGVAAVHARELDAGISMVLDLASTRVKARVRHARERNPHGCLFCAFVTVVASLGTMCGSTPLGLREVCEGQHQKIKEHRWSDRPDGGPKSGGNAGAAGPAGAGGGAPKAGSGPAETSRLQSLMVAPPPVEVAPASATPPGVEKGKAKGAKQKEVRARWAARLRGGKDTAADCGKEAEPQVVGGDLRL